MIVVAARARRGVCTSVVSMARDRDLPRPPTALDVLTAQHDQLDQMVRALDVRLAALAQPPAHAEGHAMEELDAIDAQFRRLVECVAAHAAMEERVFYKAVRARQVDETLVDARHEHGAIKRVLDEMFTSGVEHECFRAQLKVLAAHLHQHERVEEEQILFPKLRLLFSEEELTALGREMAALFDEMRRRPEAPVGRRRPR